MFSHSHHDLALRVHVVVGRAYRKDVKPGSEITFTADFKLSPIVGVMFARHDSVSPVLRLSRGEASMSGSGVRLERLHSIED